MYINIYIYVWINIMCLACFVALCFEVWLALVGASKSWTKFQVEGGFPADQIHPTASYLFRPSGATANCHAAAYAKSEKSASSKRSASLGVHYPPQKIDREKTQKSRDGKGAASIMVLFEVVQTLHILIV